MQIFLYDDLMYKDRLEAVILCKVLSVKPAFVTPTILIDAERYDPSRLTDKNIVMYPVMIDKSTNNIVTMPCTVFGTLVDVDGGMEVLRRLDAFYTCSMAPLGENKPTDLFHRKEFNVKVIQFVNIQNFMNYDFEIEEEVMAYAYIGNNSHLMLKKKVADLKHSRIGSVWRAFFSVFL